MREQVDLMAALAYAAASSLVLVVDTSLLFSLAQLPQRKTPHAAGSSTDVESPAGEDSRWDGSTASAFHDNDACVPASRGLLDAAVQVALWLLHIIVPEVEATFPALRSLTTTGRLRFALQALSRTACQLAAQASVPVILHLPDVDRLAATHPGLLSALDEAINSVRSPAD